MQTINFIYDGSGDFSMLTPDSYPIQPEDTGDKGNMSNHEWVSAFVCGYGIEKLLGVDHLEPDDFQIQIDTTRFTGSRRLEFKTRSLEDIDFTAKTARGTYSACTDQLTKLQATMGIERPDPEDPTSFNPDHLVFYFKIVK